VEGRDMSHQCLRRTDAIIGLEAYWSSRVAASPPPPIPGYKNRSAVQGSICACQNFLFSCLLGHTAERRYSCAELYGPT
jgi:hypothetical protein